MRRILKHLLSQGTLLLLRHLFAISKLLHSLRTSPCFLSPMLQEYDKLLKSIVSDIVNINFSVDNQAWTQASLSVDFGELGIRSAVQLSPSAFLASAAACTDVVHHIIPSHLQSFPLLHFLDAKAFWSDGHDLSPPEGTAQHTQKAWDTLKMSATTEGLLENDPDGEVMCLSS